MSMRSLLAFAVVSMVAVSLAYSGDETPQPPKGWKEYTPADRSFTCWIPTNPKRTFERTRTTTLRGQSMKLTLLHLEMANGTIFQVEKVALPASLKLKRKDLEEALKEMLVSEMKGRLADEKDAKLGALSGKEYTVETGKGLAVARVFVGGGNRVVILHAEGTKEQVQDKAIMTFLDSCRLGAPKTVAGGTEPAKDPKTPADPMPKGGAAAGNALEWTEDLAKMNVPNSPAAGKLLGGDFKVEQAKWEGGSLLLRQGSGFFADASVRVSLFLKAGESIAGKTFQIKKNPTALAPHVRIERLAPGQKLPNGQTFSRDYTMRLEFSQLQKNGMVEGIIYVCLPDEGRSVVAGTFTVRP
jgi:hypothetical protein